MLERKKERRYALLMCGEDSEYLLKKHGGCYGFFTRMLAEEGEIWDIYKVHSGDFPEDDDLPFYDGFVITGSCHDAHANDPWIHNLLTLVHRLDTINKKILGICFGHQILGRALGGKVGRSPAGWDIGEDYARDMKEKAAISMREPDRETWKRVEAWHCHGVALVVLSLT
ncbi:Glutamine amidotransferase [Sesbania bispinosa]|nr:Glutamine amidotransferase [Sesbania bispinosa]